MKAVLAVLIVALAPSRITFGVLGFTVSLPAGWLILAAELLASGAAVWLVIRAARRFRSSPFVRPAFAGGAR